MFLSRLQILNLQMSHHTGANELGIEDVTPQIIQTQRQLSLTTSVNLASHLL